MKAKLPFLLTHHFRANAPGAIILPSGILSYPKRINRGSNQVSIVYQQLTIRITQNQSTKLSTPPCKRSDFCRFCTLFQRKVSIKFSRRVGPHDATCWSTRRELIGASSRLPRKTDAKTALFRPFPKCAIIDTLKA